jgi:hypothetical protein
MRTLLLALVLLSLVGCAAVKSIFTEPTGVITIERQDFLDTWALVTVLAEDFFAEADRACAAGSWPPVTCAKLPGAKVQAKALAVAVRAKIAVPESRFDWGAVKELLGILVSLRP